MRTVLTALVLLPVLVTDIRAVELGLPSAVVGDGLGVGATYFDGPAGSPSGFDMIQASGCKFVRLGLPWDAVESTKGQYDFSAFDPLYSACAARGVRVLWQLQLANPQTYNLYGMDAGSAIWRQGFTDFATAAAAHYSGSGDVFEMWNEPDGTWVGGPPNVSQYMAMVQQAVPAMRQADPDCTIVGPASGVNTTWLNGCFSRGLLNLVDAVSVHPYQSGIPEGVVDSYATVRGRIAHYHPSGTVPILSTEWGYSTASGGYAVVPTDQLQGDYLARSFLVNLSQGIPLSIWYSFRDTGPDPTNYEDNFGTVTPGYQPKAAYQELQLLTHSLKGESFTTRLTTGIPSNDWLLVFTSPSGQQTLAAWTTGDAHTDAVSGWGTLNLTSTPFYVNPTLLPGDANLDGTVDVLDLAILAANYRKNVTGGWMQGDFNNDGVVDVRDLALLAANYRHSLASDVVPAYDGLDPAAIEFLSLAGVTVVPEPGAVVLSVTGLIGALACAWMKRGKAPVC